MIKLNFQQSLFQSSLSHDPSEIILYYHQLCCLFLWKPNNYLNSKLKQTATYWPPNVWMVVYIVACPANAKKNKWRKTCQLLSPSCLKFSISNPNHLSVSQKEWEKCRGRMETSPASAFEITALISPEHYSLQIIVYPIYMHLPVQTIKRPAACTEVSGYECQRIHDHSTIYLMGLQHNNIIQFKPPRMSLPLLRLNCIIA